MDDNIILYGFVAGFTLNVILASQMLYYWKSPAKPKKAQAQAQAQTPASKPAKKAPVAESSGASPKPSGKTPTTRRRG